MKTINALKYAILFTAVAAIASPGTLQAEIDGKERISSSKKAANSQPGKVDRVSTLIGKKVYTEDGKGAGRLSNLVVDLESGRVLYAIVNTGGDRIAVAPGVFRERTGENLRLMVSQRELQGAPAFTDEVERSVASAEFVNRVHQHFKQGAWWEGKPGTAAQGSFNSTYLVNDLSGVRVRNVSDQEIGTVKSVLVNLPASRVMYVVIAPDRDLKLGDNYYVLPPMQLTKHSDGKSLVTDVTRERLAAAPKFDKEEWPNLSSRDWASRVYSYYGKDANFMGTGLTPTGRSSSGSWEERERKADHELNKAEREMEDVSDDLRRERDKWDDRD